MKKIITLLLKIQLKIKIVNKVKMKVENCEKRKDIFKNPKKGHRVNVNTLKVNIKKIITLEKK